MSGKDNQGGGGNSFYMVRPDSNATKPMIEAVSGKVGEYNVTMLIGQSTTNPNNRNRNAILLVGFVNGKQLPGVMKINDEEEYTFPDPIKPNKSGEIEVAIAPVRTPDPDYGMKITLTRKELMAVAPLVAPTVDRIRVTKTSKAADGFHTVHIQLFNEQGVARAGEVHIEATQKFLLGSSKKEHPGFAEVSIPVTGLKVRIKAIDWNEEFRLSDTGSTDIRKIQLLKG